MARINPGAMMLDGGDVAGPKNNAAAVKAAEEAQAKADALAAAAQKALEDAKTKADALAAIKAADAAAAAQVAAAAQAKAAAEAAAAKTVTAKAAADKAVADAKAASIKAAADATASVSKATVKSTKTEPVNAGVAPLTGPSWQQIADSNGAIKAPPPNTTPAKEMDIKDMTQDQIDERTRAVVTAGGLSTDRNNELPGETSAQANARINAGYKKFVSQPILTQEQIDGGMKVQWVREGAGGRGAYVAVKPFGYKGSTKITNFTPGVIPEGTKYTTGSAVGLDTGGRSVDEFRKILVGKLVVGKPLTAKEREWLDANPEGSTLKTPVPPTGKKTVVKTVKNPDGSTTVTYSDGTSETTFADKPTSKKEVSKVDNKDGTFTVTYDDGSTEITGTKTVSQTDRPIGTPPAFVYDPLSKTWKMPEKPTEEGNWVWDNLEGWTNTNVTPGSTGMEAGNDRTLAQDTFKNTLALFFGASEMSQPWANALFKVVSGYYKSGSTIDESLNLALQEARNNPVLEPFTKRFAGVFALQDRRAKGEALDVPTIAEFFKSQVELGDRLREVGLGDLASNEILGEVLGTGKSVAAVLNLVNDVFMTIDNAPEQLKKDLQAVAPGIDRTSIAKALLLGQRGAEALQKQIKEVSILSAAKSQGIGIDNAMAADIAARGVDYGSALTNFGTVAKAAQPYQKLTEISTGQAVKPTDAQGTLIKSLFQQDVKAQEQIRLEGEKEIARFSGSSGTFGSRSLASRNRANRVI
jgi:hypothetical protein